MVKRHLDKGLIVKWISISLLCILAVCLFFVATNRAMREDDEVARKSQQAAESAALDRAQFDCSHLNLSSDVCANITAVTGSSDCEGETCWVVVMHGENGGNSYGSSARVLLRDGKYTVVDYMRDDGTRP